MSQTLTVRLATPTDVKMLTAYLIAQQLPGSHESLVQYKLTSHQTLIALALDDERVVGYCTASLIPTLSDMALTAIILELSAYEGTQSHDIKESLIQLLELNFKRLSVERVVFLPPLKTPQYGYQPYQRVMHYKKIKP